MPTWMRTTRATNLEEYLAGTDPGDDSSVPSTPVDVVITLINAMLLD